MAFLNRIFSRLVNFLRPGRSEDDLSRELAAHLALLEEDFARRGLSRERARTAARLALGGVELTKDLHRDARSFLWLEDARRDAGFAVRLLRRNPIIAATAAASLAIGIGANTAIFTVANALLFRAPVGVSEPARLVDIGVSRDAGGFNPGSYPTYLDLRQRTTTLTGVYAHPMFPHAMSLEVATAGQAERVFGHFVTLNYFTLLGAYPAAGRLFDATDSEHLGASPIAVLGYKYWSRRFHRDPAVVGRALNLNGRIYTVIGVAADGFQGTGVVAGDIWLPLTMLASANGPNESMFTTRAGGWLVMGGRLKPGVSLQAAAAEVETIGRDLAREYPDPAAPRGLRLLPSSSVPGNRTIVLIFVVLLSGIVSLVLLVACANISGILLARAAARRHEIAVRLAIGASRGRLVRQLLMETLTLFTLGGAAGLALARVMTSLVVERLPALPFPVSVSLGLDGRIVAFTMGLSFVAALLAGLAPALQATKIATLKDESQGPGRSRLRNAFVIVQVAFSMVLIVAAGLFVRALERAGTTNPGFEPHGVELVTLDLSMAGYTETTGPRFWRELIERVRRLPGVQAATLGRAMPGGFEGIGQGVSIPGLEPPNGQRFFSPGWNIVEPGYFGTLRIPLLGGRDFTDADTAATLPVAIVSEAAARQFWPNQNPLGQQILQALPAKTLRTLVVVGVARDIKSSSLIDGLAESFVYVPLQQQYRSNLTSIMTIAARPANGQPIEDAVRAAVASMNPNLPIVSSQTLEESVALGMVPQHVIASISGSLGVIALFLASMGIYGVTTFAVTRRTREFGIRLALGATRGDIVRMVLQQGMSLTIIGCAMGLLLGAAAAQVLAGFLFGLPPLDWLTFGGSAALFAAIGMAACYGPARRATNVDPLAALRHE
jgi:predicted permease